MLGEGGVCLSLTVEASTENTRADRLAPIAYPVHHGCSDVFHQQWFGQPIPQINNFVLWWRGLAVAAKIKRFSVEGPILRIRRVASSPSIPFRSISNNTISKEDVFTLSIALSASCLPVVRQKVFEALLCQERNLGIYVHCSRLYQFSHPSRPPKAIQSGRPTPSASSERGRVSASS